MISFTLPLLFTDLKDESGELIHSLERIYVGDAIHSDYFEDKLPGLIDVSTNYKLLHIDFNLIHAMCPYFYALLAFCRYTVF